MIHILRRAVVYQVPNVEQYAYDHNNNTASITHQVRAAVCHGGGSWTSVPVFVYYFFLKIKPLVITRAPVLISLYTSVHFWDRPLIVTPTQGFVLY